MPHDERLRVYFDPDEIAGSGNPYAGYPWAWFMPFGAAIKEHVREQAGHRCERCSHPFVVGETPGEWSPCDAVCTHGGPVQIIYTDGLPATSAQWRILTVHHLNGVKHDCRWWNLAALCQRCHLTIQAKVYMDRPYPMRHKDWFAPHAAGFYATKYLGVDLDRGETMARLDELLALEQTHDPLF